MSPTTQLSPEELADKKAKIAQQQAADTDAAVEVDAALHRLADRLHNEAFTEGTPPLPSFADSLKAAAVKLIAKAAAEKGFPPAALARLRLYAPDATTATTPTPTPDPIAEAEQAVEENTHA